MILFKKNLLWYQIKTNEVWGELKLFPKNINIGKYQRHACFSKEGKTIYFSSNSSKGLGGYDLFKSISDKNGNWSEPINLGSDVNTLYDEDSPFLSQDGTRLYFSSEGHLGFGGFDIFYTSVTNDTYSPPTNLGTPINSSADDIFFKMDDETQGGIYFSSSRFGGFGNMDIYYMQVGSPLSSPDCIAHVNPKYNVSIDAEESIDSLGVPLKYIWNMGDGSVAYGKKLNYAYERPGIYSITLDVIDSLSGRKIKNELLQNLVGDIPLEIKGKTHIEAFGPSKVTLGNDLSLDATISQVENAEIINYSWKSSNGQSHNGSKFIQSFNEAGIYDINLEVKALDKFNKVYKYCVSKKVEVIERAKDSIIAIIPKDTVVPKDSIIPENIIAIDPKIDITNLEEVPKENNIQLLPIHFDFDKYNIRADAKIILDRNIKILKQNPEFLVKIAAHTDSKGSNEYNKILSENRAKSAYNYMIAKGIEKERIIAIVALGEEQPIAPNVNSDGSDNPVGRQKNRRDEFIPLRKKSGEIISKNEE